MEGKSFPTGLYYAQYICVSFEQGSKLPPVLRSHTNHFDLFEASKDQITPEIVDALLTIVRQGNVRNIYITPFWTTASNVSLCRDQLINEWHYGYYTHGCGAVVFNQEHSTAFFNKLNEYTLNRKLPLKAGYRQPAYPPVIFDTNDDMAKAVGNLILTGSLDGTKERPPALSDTRRGVDPGLLFWIENVLGSVPQSADELSKVTGLLASYYVPGYPEFPDWLAFEPGNWSLLAELPNLQVLFLPELELDSYEFLLRCRNLQRVDLSRTNLSDPAMLKNLSHVTYLDLPASEFGDFSFLMCCSEIEILDLSRTDFRDCSILAQMPNLKRVFLPAKRQLLHTELLEALPVQVIFDPSRVRGREVEPFETMEPSAAKEWNMAPPYKVLYIDKDGETCEGLEITEAYVRNLRKDIQKGKVGTIYASLEPYGEDEYLQLDMSDEWATLSLLNSNEPFYYIIYNPEHSGDSEEALEVEVDCSIPKMHAVSDFKLAADCMIYFIKTGKLYPGAYWAKYYE